MQILFDRVITGDKTWCFQYDPETKHQSMQWKTHNSPRLKKACMYSSQFKTMLVCFFDHKGIIHYGFTAQGQTVNQFRNADKVRGICFEEKTQTLA
jgi:hypothetical protein